jgi:adenylate cyclase
VGAGDDGPESGVPSPATLGLQASLLGDDDKLSARQAGELTGVDLDDILLAWRSLGFAAIDPDEPVFLEDTVRAFAAFSAGKALFGDEAVLQFARVVGASLARIADAAMSLARTQLHGPLHDAGADEQVIAKAIEEADVGLAMVAEMLGPVFRHHAVNEARRNERLREGVSSTSFDRARVVVGFIDLVGSTRLFEVTDPTVLARALARFDATAADEVTSRGGRVVKLIGDEVMVAFADPLPACEAVLALRAFVQADPVLTDVRGALASGEVVTQDGDLYGPTVNLAARAVGAAAPGRLVVTAELASAVQGSPGLEVAAGGAHELRDVGAVQLFEVTSTPG